MVMLPANKTVDHENVQKKKIGECPKNGHSEKGAENVKTGDIQTIECQSSTVLALPLMSHSTQCQPYPSLKNWSQRQQTKRFTVLSSEGPK